MRKCDETLKNEEYFGVKMYNNLAKKINQVIKELYNFERQFNNYKHGIEGLKNDLTVNVNNKINELQQYEDDFKSVEEIENKNIEQDTRLKQVEYKNKVQDTYISGLFNENNDKRLTIEGEGNSLKLEGSKEGLVTVDKVVGNTLVNIMPNINTISPNLNDGTDLGYYSIVFDRLINSKTYNLVILNNPCITQYYISSLGISWTNVGNSFIVNNSNLNQSEKRNLQFKTTRVLTNEELSNLKFILVEGNTSPTQAIEGMQSSFEENLVTQEMVTQGLESAENLGKYKVPVRVVRKNYINDISILDGASNKLFSLGLTSTSIYRVVSKNNFIIRIVEYQNESNVLVPSTTTNDIEFTLTDGVEWVLQIWNADWTRVDKTTTDLKLYDKNSECTVNTYLNSPLLEGDEIVEYNGELCHYHKCEYGIVDGSDDEKWTQSNGDSVGIYKYVACTNYADFMSKANGRISDTLINNYGLTMINPYSNPNSGMMFVLGSSLRVRLAPNKDTLLEDFLTIVRNNPIIIVYTLAEPWYEPIQADKLLLECANDSTLHIESIVPVESVKASYTGNVPSVYALEETNANQDNLIDISLMATDEMYMMLEPILEMMPTTMNINKRMVSKMVDMYVAMVIRGLKTIDEVPVRYRKTVQDIINKLEN